MTGLPPPPLFVDTAGWFAGLFPPDPAHGRVRPLLESYGGPILTSNYVLDELLTLGQRRLSHQHAVHAGTHLLDADIVHMERITPADEDAAWQLFQERPGRGYSFTDCTSMALMGRLGIEDVATTDADFAAEGFTVHPEPDL